MKQIMLSKVMKPISFLGSSKCNCYIIIMYGFQFENIIMIFINIVLAHVINWDLWHFVDRNLQKLKEISSLYQKSPWSDSLNLL